ncbi:hypothetical protein [Streptomyces arboris]|uniref:hypothetical protein n=1 Tax=Streptomyces arboris TaxID=2600619 RepID=UPI003BF4C8A2
MDNWKSMKVWVNITQDGQLKGASLRRTKRAWRKHTLVFPKKIDSLELIIGLLEAGKGLRIAQPGDEGARLVVTRRQDQGVRIDGSHVSAVAADLILRLRETIKVLAEEQQQQAVDMAAADGEWLTGERVRGADDRTRSESIHTIRGGLPTLGRRR